MHVSSRLPLNNHLYDKISSSHTKQLKIQKIVYKKCGQVLTHCVIGCEDIIELLQSKLYSLLSLSTDDCFNLFRRAVRRLYFK